MTSSTAATSATGGSTWVQTGQLAFVHKLAGADRVYEQISEVPGLTIPFPGVWQVSYSVRTNLGNPASFGGLYITSALSTTNGGIILGSEAISGKYFNPNEAAQDTISQTFLYQFKVGEVVTLHAYRIGQGGAADILSNADGRTAVAAHWVSPGF